MADELEVFAPNEVAFDYVKARDFRVMWADGAVGSITPSGLIHFALYAERQAIPRRRVYSVVEVDSDTLQLGSELLEKRISRNSIVREMGCDVMMSPQAAETFALWLLSQVNEMKGYQVPEK